MEPRKYMAISGGRPIGGVYVTPDVHLPNDGKLHPLPELVPGGSPHYGCHPELYDRMQEEIYSTGPRLGVFMARAGDDLEVTFR